MEQLLVISSAPLIFKNNRYYCYSPYEKEMEIWAKYSDDVVFCCPIWKEDRGLLNSRVNFKNYTIIPLKDFNIKFVSNYIRSVYYSLINCYIIYKAMRQADHIHLRCPGNIGLLGCFVQILFPNKIKTAKYAGNWDPNAKNPWTYRLQQKILSNTFLTRNMQVLVYGAWEGQSKNCKSFFTASYFEKEKKALNTKKGDSKITFVFVGTLVLGKNPMYAIQLIEELFRTGFDVSLDLYGEGVERANLEKYILKNNLAEVVALKGNQDRETLKKAYQESHFVLLPSASEGWPKAIAEGMFWGCVPIATAVSCVPYMLDYGKRGVLLAENIQEDVSKIASLLHNKAAYTTKQHAAFSWSQNYTLDVYETEIKKLLVSCVLFK